MALSWVAQGSELFPVLEQKVEELDIKTPDGVPGGALGVPSWVHHLGLHTKIQGTERDFVCCLLHFSEHDSIQSTNAAKLSSCHGIVIKI